MESRVVPGSGVTIFLSSPSRELTRDDFPTLGLPTIATLGRSGTDSSDCSGRFPVTSSRRSPVPLPFIELTGKNSLKPIP